MGIFQKRFREKPVELRDFISNTLVQIIEGVSNAQEYALSKDAEINPSEGFASNFEKLSRTLKSHRLVHIVEFDVAVTVAESKQLSGGIGIVVPELSIGYRGTIGNEKSAISRIRFSIPLILPTQQQSEQEN